MAAPLIGFAARLAAKRGFALMTRKEYAKKHKDFKGTTNGKKYVLKLNPKTQATERVRVLFKD